MFEQVRKPGLARNLVLVADVLQEFDRDDRGEVILSDDDSQAVVEMLVAEHDLGYGRCHA